MNAGSQGTSLACALLTGALLRVEPSLMSALGSPKRACMQAALAASVDMHDTYFTVILAMHLQPFF